MDIVDFYPSIITEKLFQDSINFAAETVRISDETSLKLKLPEIDFDLYRDDGLGVKKAHAKKQTR